MSGTFAMLAAAMLVLLSWAPPALAQKPRAHGNERVLETFNVGSNVYVRALTVEPKTSTLWVGSSVGVNEVDLHTGTLRRSFTRKDGLANEYVFAIGIDRDGYKWFGTNAGGASRYRDGKWKTFFPMHGLADYWVYAFANDRKGDLWIGTWAGASRYDAKTGKFRNYVKELINEWVYGIAVDSAGRIWFGTEGGVSMHDGKSWKSWAHEDGVGAPNTEKLPPSANTGLGTRSRHDLNVTAGETGTYNPSYVFAVHAEPRGGIWAGTWGGGASRYDGKRWTNFSTRDGLAGNIVYSIVQDSGGVIWFGTNAGVTRYDGKFWRTIGRRDGLLENHVYALAVAPNGDVWAGTKHGVSRIGRR